MSSVLLLAHNAQRPCERLFHEVNLLRLEGYYFCFDPKQASQRRDERYEFFETIANPEKAAEHPVVILANPRYGYPSALAYKVLHAMVKKLSDYGYPVPNTVYFSQRELFAKGAVELGNIVAGAMVFGQFISRTPPDFMVFLLGIFGTLLFYRVAYDFSRLQRA